MVSGDGENRVSMLHAFRLYTGSDHASHVEEGTVEAKVTTSAVSVSFAESAPHSSLDWHNAPTRQFVITLSGTLEFKMRDGTSFTIRPGDVMLAEDTTGSGHAWRLIDDQPWRRAYVVLLPDTADIFTPR
jgi:quercetin dioxygenase-like cupin family protein